MLFYKAVTVIAVGDPPKKTVVTMSALIVVELLVISQVTPVSELLFVKETSKS